MKAILVVDIPDDVFIDDCKIEYRVIENVMKMCVTSGVERLKPMPQKYDEGIMREQKVGTDVLMKY